MVYMARGRVTVVPGSQQVIQMPCRNREPVSFWDGHRSVHLMANLLQKGKVREGCAKTCVAA